MEDESSIEDMSHSKVSEERERFFLENYSGQKIDFFREKVIF